MSAERRLAIATIGFRGGIGGGTGGIIYAGGLDVEVAGELSASVEGELDVQYVGMVAVPVDPANLTVTVEEEHSVTVDGDIDVGTCE
jgi:hypothetical protein